MGTVFHRFVRGVRFNPCGVASSNLEGWVIHPKGDLIEGYVYMWLCSFFCGGMVLGLFLSPVLCFGFTYSIRSLRVSGFGDVWCPIQSGRVGVVCL